MKEKLIVIIGPTAVGKTKISVEVAKAFNGEIISGDSMQVYRGMDIGTAKVTEEEMQGVMHHLIDIKDPKESFSAAEFQQLVQPLITSINNKGKVPIIAGGTGLYIQSVLYKYEFSEAPSDEHYRQELEETAHQKGNMYLYEQLKAIDPNTAEHIHPNNLRRVIRALEVYYSTGKTVSDNQQNQSEERTYNDVLIGLNMERTVLYERINRRVDLMVKEGLFEEVGRLFNQGIRNCQSIQAIGYKEIYEYFEDKISREEAIENLKRNSRRYAKRQLTWFRNKLDARWFDMTNVNYNDKKEEILRFIAGKLKEKAK
jgi:tRNA dimethylallyltransferase